MGGGQDPRAGRGRRGGGDMGGGPGPGGGGRDTNRPAASDDIARRSARTQDFLKKLDANGNGMIDASEASDPGAKMMLDRIFSQMGKEPHYPMAIQEIVQGYEAGLRAGGNPSGGGPSGKPGSSPPAMGWASPPGMGFGARPPAPGGTSPGAFPGKPSMPGPAAPPAANLAGPTPPPGTTGPTPPGPAVASQGPDAAPAPADAKPVPRKPTRFSTARERLPKGLPDWFLEKDVDGEGQITMAKYTDNWTPADVEKFNRYDLNHDGIITAAEVLKVEKKAGASKVSFSNRGESRE